MQGFYLGALYTRWRKLKGLNLNDPKENTGQMQSSFKDFSDNVKKAVNIYAVVISTHLIRRQVDNYINILYNTSIWKWLKKRIVVVIKDRRLTN